MPQPIPVTQDVQVKSITVVPPSNRWESGEIKVVTEEDVSNGRYGVNEVITITRTVTVPVRTVQKFFKELFDRKK